MLSGKIKGGVTGKTKGGVELARLEGLTQRKAATQWILVAHRAGGVLFARRAGNITEVLQTFSHPEGRMREHEIGSDQPGRSFHTMASTGVAQNGGARNATQEEGQLREAISLQFSTKLAEHLRNGRAQQEFDELVLVAEPKFLGTLLGAMDIKTRESVEHRFEKDFAHLAIPKLQVAVERLLESI